MAKQIGKCIYCERHGEMTREEIVAAWVRKYLTDTGERATTQSIVLMDQGQRFARKYVRGKGPRYTGYIRAVCDKCNNRWMSQLQKNIKPTLLPLIQGQAGYLSIAQQEQLAAWIAMLTMNYDYLNAAHVNRAHPDTPIQQTPAIAQADRVYLRAHRRPPDNWLIWIGRMGTPETHHMFQSAVAFATREHLNAMTVDFEFSPTNTQLTVFYLGEFYGAAFSSQLMCHVKNWKLIFPELRRRLTQIWPPRTEPIYWPRAFVVDPTAAKTMMILLKLYADVVKDRDPVPDTPAGRKVRRYIRNLIRPPC
jgi:hypothetical protein